ncbi:XRE family transcriptional regulator [Sesbania bispinosa]|nr:XRE family transcriptional regulator [Sesbania bispinosa]
MNRSVSTAVYSPNNHHTLAPPLTHKPSPLCNSLRSNEHRVHREWSPPPSSKRLQTTLYRAGLPRPSPSQLLSSPSSHRDGSSSTFKHGRVAPPLLCAPSLRPSFRCSLSLLCGIAPPCAGREFAVSHYHLVISAAKGGRCTSATSRASY